MFGIELGSREVLANVYDAVSESLGKCLEKSFGRVGDRV